MAAASQGDTLYAGEAASDCFRALPKRKNAQFQRRLMQPRIVPIAMKVQHITRTGKVYYLHIRDTKSGRTNYFFSTKAKGNLADSLPAGYEVYENVRGQVFLRRPPPKIITDQEIALVRQALNDHADEWRYKIETKKNAIIIHEAHDSFPDLDRIAPPWRSRADL